MILRPWKDVLIEGLEDELLSWIGTRHASGQAVKGLAVDCTGFVCSMLNWIAGTDLPVLFMASGYKVQSASVSLENVNELEHAFGLKWAADHMQPGDVLATGPRGTWPDHVLMVGTRENELWHVTRGAGVCRTSLRGMLCMGHVPFGVWRLPERV